MPITPTSEVLAERFPVRLRQLDVIRAIAVLMVLGRHLPRCPETASASLRAAVESLRFSGWAGVDLFFVLSGFLIGGLLFAEYREHGRAEIVRFWIRRAIRIHPPFYCFVLVSLLCAPMFGRHTPWQANLAELLFLQNYLPGIWRHTWSLAVEEHFYLLLPLGLAMLAYVEGGVLSTKSLRRVVLAFVAVAMASTAFREQAWLTFPACARTHLRMDGLLFGVLLAYFNQYYPAQTERIVRRNAGVILLASLVLVAMTVSRPLESRWMRLFGFSYLYLGFGGIIITACYSTRFAAWSCRRAARPLVVIGVGSYSIYLWHYAVRDWLPPILKWQFGAKPGYLVESSVYLLLSLAVGLTMARLIEIPAIALRDRLLPRCKRGNVASATGVPVLAAPFHDAGCRPELMPG